MTLSRDDFTLEELLDDPITRAVMKADRVDPSAVEALWRGLAPRAQTVQSKPRPAIGAPWLCEPWAPRDEVASSFAACRAISQLCGAH